jgi:hypothetical protein
LSATGLAAGGGDEKVSLSLVPENLVVGEGSPSKIVESWSSWDCSIGGDQYSGLVPKRPCHGDERRRRVSAKSAGFEIAMIARTRRPGFRDPAAGSAAPACRLPGA